MKTIGVLTSGGDAPGMNACIRAVTRVALRRGLRVVGIADGYQGLLRGDFQEMNTRSVSNILHRGGTILGTSRCPEFFKAEARRQAIANLASAGIDGLVAIGGEGTFRGALALRQEGGPPLLGVPGTIDNDVAGCDRTLGFDTAVNTALEAIDRLRDTAEALSRLFVVEVMGRDSGFLALEVALAGGAEEVLIPEMPVDIDEVCQRLVEGLAQGKRSCLVVVSEGFGPGGAMAVFSTFQQCTMQETRVCILGHLQRGGAPVASDRALGALLGEGAVDGLLQGYDAHMVGVVAGALTYSPLAWSWEGLKGPSEAYLKLLKDIS
ncbi:MAG: 6-phosphofructokinase [Chloroflexi bacterium]|nr:6-phosphofructokinase [Chloroflexota bacterium]